MRDEEFMAQFVRADRSIRAFLLAASGNLTVAEDLMQNVAVALWQKWPQYDRERPFRAWALGIARIEVLRWRRSEARDRTVLDAGIIDQLAEASDRAADEADRRLALLSDCLTGVGGDAREILNLKYTVGLRSRQIAERLRKGVGAVEMILTRTRRALRECIQRKLAKA
ncbi:MAG: sigma-70 family RNA polymerase sigma factor [Planctomycetota bacterium]